MSDYDGIDFALGSVRGFRRWKVSVGGILEPVSQTGAWIPGENVSACRCLPTHSQVPEVEGEGWKERAGRAKVWRDSATFLDMSCGFYAYFDGEDESGYGAHEPHVSGVIEGYGEVLIGQKGFRAKKARILALSVAPFDGMWNLDEFVVSRVRANYPGVPLFNSELAMRSEFRAPSWEAREAIA